MSEQMSESDRIENHPAKPEMGDDEDYVAYLGRCADQWTQTPPEAPHGFVRISCLNHWPVYTVADDDFYEAPCPGCLIDSSYNEANEMRCKAQHRRWKSWRALGWLSRKAYSWGVAAACGTSYGRCRYCGIGVQHHRPRWRGSRPYILGVSRETWACLRRGHRRAESHWSRGICTICLPCPECGSASPEHWSCDPTTALASPSTPTQTPTPTQGAPTTPRALDFDQPERGA